MKTKTYCILTIFAMSCCIACNENSDTDEDNSSKTFSNDTEAKYKHLGEYCNTAVSILTNKCNDIASEFYDEIVPCLYDRVFPCEIVERCFSEMTDCDLNAVEECIEAGASCKVDSCEQNELDCEDSIFYESGEYSGYNYSDAFDECISTSQITADSRMTVAICYAGSCVDKLTLEQKVCQSN